jgi:hypothetical protein
MSTSASDRQRLTWLEAAARAVARGALPADELLSDMIASLGVRGLDPINNKGHAWQLARWRLADWKRRKPVLALPQDDYNTPQDDQEAPAAPSLPTDLALNAWRSTFERQLTRDLGRPVRLSDRRVKELLRARARRVRHSDPESAATLQAMAAAPATLHLKRGRRA